MERVIWLYWENPPGKNAEPPHVILCRWILFQVCKECDIRIVTPSNLQEYLPDFDPKRFRVQIRRKIRLRNFWEIVFRDRYSIPLKCDFIRAFLLEEYGGIYIDCDTVVLKDLSHLFDLFERYDFIAMRRSSHGKSHVSVGFYGSRARGTIISEYANRLRRMIEQKTVFDWNEVGAETLTPIVDAHIQDVYLFPERQIHPITYERAEQVFLDREVKVQDVIDDSTISFMLFHTIFKASLKGWGLRELYEGDILLSKVFRHALKQPVFHERYNEYMATARRR